MSNIDFSKAGAALLENPVLATYILQRLSILTKEEIIQGKIEIETVEGPPVIIIFGPGPNQQNSLSPKKNKNPQPT